MHATFGLSTIGQIAITVKDLPRAVAFYRDVLGVPMLFEAPGMAFFQAGDVRLMLGLPEGADGARFSSIVYFRVDDIQAAHRELQGRGVTFTHEPRLIHRGQEADLWLAFFPDPDGNTLALMSEVPRPD
ncbi:MAG: VOC family protein [Candidatus Krumholzibacteria bacterium]|nr:VOC family protein [Candidatus Krumholzibacteria bacterium]MDH4337425.1 VOC family protein [Candidatus Krumholzibacteria bacterium]MDH5271126.1 VOC family protein [Candidatus Krumholzibacteria bacterium]